MQTNREYPSAWNFDHVICEFSFYNYAASCLKNLSRHWISMNIWSNNNRLLWPKDATIGSRMRLCLWHLRCLIFVQIKLTELKVILEMLKALASISCTYIKFAKAAFCGFICAPRPKNPFYTNRILGSLVYWQYNSHP